MEEIAQKIRIATLEKQVGDLQALVEEFKGVMREELDEKNREIKTLFDEVNRLRNIEKNRHGYNDRNNEAGYIISKNYDFFTDELLSKGKWLECMRLIDSGMVSPYEFDFFRAVAHQGPRLDEDGAIKFMQYLIEEYEINPDLFKSRDHRSPLEIAKMYKLTKLQELYEKFY